MGDAAPSTCRHLGTLPTGGHCRRSNVCRGRRECGVRRRGTRFAFRNGWTVCTAPRT